MSRWFRHYAGMMRDDKLVRVAIKSRQPIERVLWLWGAILESAAEVDDGGRYDVDAAEVAYFLRTDEADIHAVLAALADAGRVADGFVVKWGNRQFQSDKSAARVAAYRERKRNGQAEGNGAKEQGNGAVTLHGRFSNAPETETETYTETEEKKGERRAKPARAYRCPADWQPKPLSEPLASEAATMPPGWIERQLAAMKDWSAASPKGAKLDWDATWRGWLRRAMGDQNNGHGHMGRNGSPAAGQYRRQPGWEWYQQVRAEAEANGWGEAEAGDEGGDCGIRNPLALPGCD